MTAESAARVRAAGRLVVDRIGGDARYGHTSHLAVQVRGELLVDEHLSGPERADVFSVTKTVLATLLGIAARDRRLPPLDAPVCDVLPELRGTPAESHTWRQLLTMTRGSRTDGPWDVDEVTALAGGQVRHIAAAPQLHPPGTRFGYDNAGVHLVSAALTSLVGPVAGYAERELFAPLGITGADWLADPDGVCFGYGHLSLRAADLVALGTLWLQAGRWRGEVLADPALVVAMTSAQARGGPPEGVPYGYLTWVDRDCFFAGGWAGQHVLVLPAAAAVVVVTGDPGFSFGPPPSDRLPVDWRPALDLVRDLLLPVLR